MNPQRLLIGLMATLLCTVACSSGAEHPRLLVSSAEVKAQANNWQQSPTFSRALEKVRVRVDAYFAAPPEVPVPHDAGGGYTHEQHKANAKAIYDAGMLYLWTGESRYADYAGSLLLAYADLYPTLGEHPQKKEQSPGRLFWQSLNEAWWLVVSIQGYDAIYDSLDAQQREKIENKLLRVMTTFLSDQSPQTFDKIHNHGTWATAAVGMTGYVLNDSELTEKALLGLKKDGSAGFLRQLDELFSPDGYYTEGPYYQRYALMPFVVFAKSIERNEPERKIFQYRNDILKKAIYSTIQLSYAGKFFPLNDAIKDKGLDTVELDNALAIAYGMTADRSLLSLFDDNSTIVLTGDGLKLAQDKDAGKQLPFQFQSMSLRDGKLGDEGALTILRSGFQPGHTALVFKATSQGMGHGHFDRLNWIYYDNGQEVIQDYGAARFLNVVQKYGGHYLPENNSWAKQTVAHNTLVVDQTSHFNASVEAAEKTAPTAHYHDLKEHIQLTSAREENAYPGVSFDRTVAMIALPDLPAPLVVDVLRARSSQRHQYDLPLYYQGLMIDSSKPLSSNIDRLVPVGEKHGYQHLWERARASIPANERYAFTWLLGNRFYTATFVADAGLDVVLTEVGANDPDFNLRDEKGLLLRASDRTGVNFVSVLEAHGEYNGAREYTTNSASSIAAIEQIAQGKNHLVKISMNNGQLLQLALSYAADPQSAHSMTLENGKTLKWNGFYKLWRE